MKKLALAILVLIGGSTAVQAQKLNKTNLTKVATQVSNLPLFKQKASELTSSLNENDIKKSQGLLTDLMRMMNTRGDDLVKAKAPKAESEARYNIGREMKSMLTDVAGNKQNIINLVQEAIAAF